VRAAILASALALASADFDAFKAKYQKVYNGVDHEASARATYEANMVRVADHNALNLGFELGENQFSDLTQDQYRVAAGLGYKAPESMQGLPHLGEHVHDGSELAASVDWTTKGAVTPVKDQGQCGSCWAFSTTGSTEGAWQISSGSLKSVSEQQLVDCATATSAGCQGGSMAGAIQYESGTAMATEASYPYTATDGTCKSSFTAAIPQGGITGYKSVGNFLFGASKTNMQSAIQQQPVSIAIEADQYAFQAYKSGVLSSGCGTSLDHGVLAVGYGTENNQDYWLVKNSWGSSWGLSGYIKISSASNVCGVLNQPVYPEVNAAVELKEEPRQYAKGFVRQARNAVVPVATITDAMRASVPDKLDYTSTGGTSPVKDQGMCGSCWAFSATQGIESAVYRASGSMPILSTQQIISCDKTDGGCNGGDLPTAFDYVESDGGIDSDSNYADTSHRFGITGSCKTHAHVAKVTDYKYAVAPCEGGSCSSQDEDGLKAALASFGPLSVCVNANDWNGYYGGVYKTKCSGSYNMLDHCVQLVGYDTTASTPFWIVKNSWGSSWGETGHIWLPMGENSCGIADEAMYVTAEMVSVAV